MKFWLRPFVLAFVFAPSLLLAADWPQWMGPNRDGRWHETGMISKFPESGPNVLWRVPIQAGYAGPAVADGRVYVMDYVLQSGAGTNALGASNTERINLTGEERLQCLDAKTGQQIWEFKYPCQYNIAYPNGPRATPTVDGDDVFILGAEGRFSCVDVETGKARWSFELTQRYKTASPVWGYSGHPLVYGDLVITLAGGEGSVAIAVNRKTGEKVWKNLTATEIGYSSPYLITAAGVEQLLIWDADNLNSLNPKTGELYWSQPLKPDNGMSIMAPRKSGDYLFASGIGFVGKLFQLSQDKPGAEPVWTSKNKEALYAANSTPLIIDGIVYGCDCIPGIFRAFDLKTGNRLWESTEPVSQTGRPVRHGTVYIAQADERFYMMSETGDLIIANLTPEGYEELSRAHILEPTSSAFNRDVLWSHPAFADKCCFARNDKEIVCVSLEK